MQEERELTAGKGSTAHFVWRCSNCKRESSAKFDTVPPKPYSADANGQLEPLVVLDCRGLEFVGFNPRVNFFSFSIRASGLIVYQGIWKCKGLESNTPFTDVDLTEGEWTDYDEKVLK